MFVAILISAASPIFPIFTIALLLAFSTGSTARKRLLLAADVIDQLPLLRRILAAGERRIEELRAPALHQPRRVERGLRVPPSRCRESI